MSDIPDYMRGFDLDQDFGFTPVSYTHLRAHET